MIRSWLYSVPAALKPASRQSPCPAASAYSNVWLQCCHAKLLPSGAARLSPSIHTPAGHELQHRISDMCSVPSGLTAQPGVPRLSSATDWPASGASLSVTRSAISAAGTSTTASARSSARPAMAAARVPGPSGAPGSPLPATISTGRSASPRRSALGTKVPARSLAAGSHSRAVPPPSSRAPSSLA